MQIQEHLLELPAAASPPAPPCLGPSSPPSRTIGRLIQCTMATMRQTHIITPATAGTKASERQGTASNKSRACCICAISRVPGNLLSKLAVGAQGCKLLEWHVGRTHGYWMRGWEGGSAACLHWIARHKLEATRKFQFCRKKPW